MSRQNKVNPGMYTQRGRLTQDDAARELRKQSAMASTDTWQPVNTPTAKAAPQGANVKTTKAKAAVTPKSKRATGSAQAGKAMAAAMKRTTTSPTRKAVLARSVGGGGAAPRPIRKRRKS